MVKETKVKEAQETGTKGKEFELTFLERMQLRNIYPVKKEYASEILRQKVMEKLIDSDEMKSRNVSPELKCGACGLVVVSEPPLKCPRCRKKDDIESEMQPTGKVRWIDKDDKGKPLPNIKKVQLGEMTQHTIEKTLKELNEAEDLDLSLVSLFEKFVLNGNKPAQDDISE